MKKKLFSTVRNLLLVGGWLTAVLTTHAQDIIVKRDGSTIMSKVTEVGIAEVKYKKWANKNGPTYVISIAELLSINYENGEKDDFSKNTPATPKDNRSGTASAGTVSADGKNYHPAPSLTVDEVMKQVGESRPYALYKKGAAAYYIMEEDGKQTKWDAGPTCVKQYVSDVRVENGVLATYIKLDYLNKKREPAKLVRDAARSRIFKNEIDLEGNYHFVHNVIRDAFTDVKSRKGYGILIEGGMPQGKKLSCSKIVETVKNIYGATRQYTTHYTDWEVLGEGTLTTPAGTFDCVKMAGYIISDEVKTRVTCWMARGIGIIRYDVGNGNRKYILEKVENYQ